MEESARVTVQKVDDLLNSEFDWVSIEIIGRLAFESEWIGRWAEACPCRRTTRTTVRAITYNGSSRRICSSVSGNLHETDVCYRGGDCPLKGCRAPELAQGVAVNLQSELMREHSYDFAEQLASLPDNQRAELLAFWSTTRSRLWRCLVCSGRLSRSKSFVSDV